MIGVGASPCCAALMVFANGMTNDLIEIVDISMKPKPPKPVGVDAMHHACSGRVVDVESGSPSSLAKYVFVSESMVDVKVVW